MVYDDTEYESQSHSPINKASTYIPELLQRYQRLRNGNRGINAVPDIDDTEIRR